MIDADLDTKHRWRKRAACKHHPYLRRNDFFADGQGVGPKQEAIDLCWKACPVRLECEEYALEEIPVDQQYGVFGGLLPDERIDLIHKQGVA